ncbi:hypothetical protein JCM8208_004803, partial [Rhodotorula glutinis]
KIIARSRSQIRTALDLAADDPIPLGNAAFPISRETWTGLAALALLAEREATSAGLSLTPIELFKRALGCIDAAQGAKPWTRAAVAPEQVQKAVAAAVDDERRRAEGARGGAASRPSVARRKAARAAAAEAAEAGGRATATGSSASTTTANPGESHTPSTAASSSEGAVQLPPAPVGPSKALRKTHGRVHAALKVVPPTSAVGADGADASRPTRKRARTADVALSGT